MRCPNCGSPRLVEGGEVVCRDCGLVVSPSMDAGPEWRAYTEEERAERARGEPVSLLAHDRGMGSEIDWRNRDSFGNPLTPEGRAWAGKMRRLQRRTRTRDGRDVLEAVRVMGRVASALFLPRGVVERAVVLYRRASPLRRGMGVRRTDLLAVACLYAACRLSSLPRSLEEVARASELRREDVGRAYRAVCRTFSLKPPPVAPEEYFFRAAQALGLSGEERERGMEILRSLEGREVLGKSPLSLAAAAAYLACGGRVRLAEVRRATGVSAVTIRCRVRELRGKVPVWVRT